jgi:putative ABC transport system permease protein
MPEDLRFAFRQLRKNPGFAIVAVLTLGVGIGAATAMFGLIQGVLLSPPPYADPGRLVLLSPARTDGLPYEQGSTTGHWLAWRNARTIEPPALYRWTFNFMVLPDGSESLGGMVVTTNYFRTLGVRPLLGRELTDEEAAAQKVPPTAVVIGHDLWRRKFNSDPAILGKTITLSRMAAPLPIVGVMPPGVRFLPDPGAASEPNYDVNAHVDFFLATTIDEARPSQGAGNAVARLRPAASLPEAQAEIAASAAGLAGGNPDLQGLTATVSSLQDVLTREGRQLLVPLFGSVALVFLIACANVAGLLLARGLQRQQEYAMRSALGAGRSRLFRQMLTESVALALVSAVVGAALATTIVTVLKGIGGQAVPRADAVSIGWPVFAFGCLAALIAAATAGLLPALRASRPGRFSGLSGARTSVSRAERRLLGGIATLQIVLTIGLLGGAALLVRTARNLERVQPGYDTEHILAMTVTTVQRGQWKDFHTRALERVAAIPGVSHVAFAWGLPLTGNKWPAEIEIPGLGSTSRVADRLDLPLRAVTPDYFSVMGMALAEGRNLQPSDDDKAPRVAVINTALQRRYFAGVNPIGRTMRFAGDTTGKPIEIVGVVADTRTEALSEPARPEIYLSLWQNTAFSKHMVVRTAGDPLLLAGRVRAELHAVDPTSAVEHVTTMAEIRRQSTAARTFAMRLLSAFAVVATLLAAVGLYGVLSLSVGSRTKEIAVRKAIGAQGHQIVRLVLGEVARLVAVGLAAGTITALAVGRLLRTLLFEVRPADPIALAAASAVFVLAALVACYRPVRRAGRVDLMEVLRQE